MRYEMTDLGDGACRVALHGRLDALGAEEIGTPFTAAVASGGKHALVDLSGVAFLSSLGIRLLLAVARPLQRRGARMVLFGAQGQVREVLEAVSIDGVVPVVADEQAALALVRG